jgi:dienelactone hydrolase
MRSALILFVSALALAACTGSGASNNSIEAANNQTANGTAPNSVTSVTLGQTVTIDSLDGVKLVGTFLESPKPNSPALLLLHQWQSDRHSYDDFAKRMQAKGFNVLAIDGRGFGESTKRKDGTAVKAERTDEAVKLMLGDVGAACDFLVKQKNVDPSRIAIVGASYGSSLALIYGADNAKVKAVVALSPGLNYFGNMPTEPVVRRYGDRPLLLVAADDDKESADSVRKLKATVAQDKYEEQIYPKGGHGTSLFAAKVGLDDLLEKFLVKNV